MAEGNSAYRGSGVPLHGNSEIVAINDTSDIVTITGYTTDQTGDFLVCQTAAGTEKFVVDASGNVTAAGTLAVTGASTHTGNMTVSGTLVVTGASTHTGNMVASGTLAVTGAQTAGSTLVVSGSSSYNSMIAKMVLGTVALASLASNASATVALTGIATNTVISVYQTTATTAPTPVVWADSANKLGYGAPSTACAAQTVAYWMFASS